MKNSDYTILIVEDDNRHLESWEKLLKFKGYNVISARNGETALSLFRKNRPDIVLMDIQLSEHKDSLNGIDVAESIMAIQEVPIIFITAHKDKGYHGEAINRVKYASFRHKPIDPDDLVVGISDELRKFYQEKSPSSFSFRCDGIVYDVKAEELACIISDSGRTTVHIYRNQKASKYILTYNLAETIDMFFDGHPQLIRTHRQYYVNMYWKDAYDKSEDTIILRKPFENEEIRVGETYRENVLKWINGRK